MSSPLRALLEEEAGWEEFQMNIPHPFLPPRYQELSNNRNMILVLDRDMTLHVRWEGSRLHEHHPLTPRATRHLIREVLARMTKYRREIQVFSRFIEQSAELPFDDPRALDPIRIKEREFPPAEPIVEEDDEAVEVSAEVEIREQLEGQQLAEQGGESPMGGDFFEQ